MVGSLFALHRRATIQGVRTIIGLSFSGAARRHVSSSCIPPAARHCTSIQTSHRRQPIFSSDVYIFLLHGWTWKILGTHKFRVPFVRSTLPVILSSRVSSFLSCQIIHAHVRARVVQRYIMVGRLFDVKVVFSAVVGTISYKRNKWNISNGESPRWNEWNPFLVSVTIIDCTWEIVKFFWMDIKRRGKKEMAFLRLLFLIFNNFKQFFPLKFYPR